MKTVTLLNSNVYKTRALVSVDVHHIGLDNTRSECWVLSHETFDDVIEQDEWHIEGRYFPTADEEDHYVPNLVKQAFDMFDSNGYTLYHVGLLKHWNDNDILTHVDYDVRLLFAMELYAIWQHVKETQWKLSALSEWSAL